MTTTAAEVMAAIDAAVVEWDESKPECVVVPISVGYAGTWTATKIVELQKGARKIIVKFLADDYRDTADVGQATKDFLDLHESQLDNMLT